MDQTNYELINGNYNLVCDSGDDLHVKACLFYCRVNWYPYGECVRQNNVPICKCGNQPEIINFNVTTTTPSTSTTTTAMATTIPNGMVI